MEISHTHLETTRRRRPSTNHHNHFDALAVIISISFKAFLVYLFSILHGWWGNHKKAKETEQNNNKKNDE